LLINTTAWLIDTIVFYPNQSLEKRCLVEAFLQV